MDMAVLRRFARVASSEHDVVDFALAARTQVDHFADVRKMVCRRMTRCFAGYLSFGDHLDEVLSLRVTKQPLKVAGKPEFDTVVGLPRMRFEVLGQRVNQFGLHVQTPKVGALIGIPGSIGPGRPLASRPLAIRPVRREDIKKAESLYQGLRFQSQA
jgi:hypothetical protein